MKKNNMEFTKPYSSRTHTIFKNIQNITMQNESIESEQSSRRESPVNFDDCRWFDEQGKELSSKNQQTDCTLHEVQLLELHSKTFPVIQRDQETNESENLPTLEDLLLENNSGNTENKVPENLPFLQDTLTEEFKTTQNAEPKNLSILEDILLLENQSEILSHNFLPSNVETDKDTENLPSITFVPDTDINNIGAQQVGEFQEGLDIVSMDKHNIVDTDLNESFNSNNVTYYEHEGNDWELDQEHNIILLGSSLIVDNERNEVLFTSGDSTPLQSVENNFASSNDESKENEAERIMENLEKDLKITEEDKIVGTKKRKAAENLEQDSESSDDQNLEKRRCRIAIKEEWTNLKNKRLREQGKTYKGWSRSKGAPAKRGIERNERKLGPRCSSSVCTRRKVMNCQVISEEGRKTLFNNFWSQMNWDQRKIYISSLFTKSKTPRLTKGPWEVSRRGSTFKYTLNINGKVSRVCKKMFLSTFDLREWSVLQWAKTSESGIHPSREVLNSAVRAVYKKQGPRTDSGVAKNILVEFLEYLAKLPSYYCRASTNKLYLEPIYGNSMSDVYREYLKYSSQKNPGMKPLSRHTFDYTVKEKNIAFQTPKKDKCDTCCSYESKNLDTQTYDEHIRRKELARDEKNRDKLLGAKNEAVVLAQDMQAVKVCPYLNASALYYKTKLICHNFTVFDINTNNCVCYWFNETDADLTANTFASCIVDYILQIEHLTKPVTIWSDGCTYQNKNAVLSNALLSLSVHKNITIYQKYLERGHTQMEVDSVHAAIERNLKNKSIYLPSDYFRATMEARKKNPYTVKNIHFDFAKDYSVSPKFDSIRPGRRVNDPTVNDIKVIKCTPDGNIQVKLKFDDDFLELPQRRVEKPVPDLQ